MIPPKIARHDANKPEQVAVLKYSIAQELLTGVIGHDAFTLTAYSGGGRGRKGAGAEHSFDSYQTTRQTFGDKHAKSHVHGGPIPRGFYNCVYVLNDREFHECIRLDPIVTEDVAYDKKHGLHHTRSNFFIHGRGPHGSDGCIVPSSNAERLRLNKAIRYFAGSVLLVVREAGMPLPAEELPPRYVV